MSSKEQQIASGLYQNLALLFSLSVYRQSVCLSVCMYIYLSVCELYYMSSVEDQIASGLTKIRLYFSVFLSIVSLFVYLSDRMYIYLSACTI